MNNTKEEDKKKTNKKHVFHKKGKTMNVSYNTTRAWMQQGIVSAFHGCIEEQFLLSMPESNGCLCYPWMQES